MHAPSHAALVPNRLTRARAASSQSTSRSGIAGAAVVQHRDATDEHRADEEVPHHPAGRREPRHAGRPAGRRTSARSPSRAPARRRRGRGRSPWAARSCPTSRGSRADGRTGPARTVSGSAGPARRSAQAHLAGPRVAGGVGSRYGTSTVRSRPGQRGTQLVDDSAAIEPLAAVGVAVDRDQHLRFDLGEAVDQALRPEVRRAARPDRARGWRRPGRR